jgi:muramoyltetrapeptide carboxypeptidase
MFMPTATAEQTETTQAEPNKAEQSKSKRPKLIKPKGLKKGGCIGIISPAAPTQQLGQFYEGAQLLASAGYYVKQFPHAHHQENYLAGSDESRQADLIAAFQDPDVDAILCARGGYGSMRLLKDFPMDVVKKNPKPIIGFSDITALLIAFYQEAGLISYYGPMLTSNLIEQDAYTWDNLLSIISDTPAFHTPHSIPNQDELKYHCITKGTAKAPLYAGNLTLLAALCGTPYQPDPTGHILCIEDWKESHYSLDRQFQQLRMVGIFDNIAGLLLCDFSQTTPEPTQSLRELFIEQFSDLDVPVGYGFSVGHGHHTATLPMGVQAQFNAEAGTLELLEAPVKSQPIKSKDIKKSNQK